MTYRIVISGSRSIETLPQSAEKEILKAIVDRAQIFIGDAPGIDLLVRQFIERCNYPNVTIYHAYDRLRNNVGRWPTRGGYESYVDRDVRMHADGDRGLCIWDGISRGTKANIARLPSKIIKV